MRSIKLLSYMYLHTYVLYLLQINFESYYFIGEGQAIDSIWVPWDMSQTISNSTHPYLLFCVISDSKYKYLIGVGLLLVFVICLWYKNTTMYIPTNSNIKNIKTEY